MDSALNQDIDKVELDKVKRRLAILKRLKDDTYKRIWSPYNAMAQVRFTDPAVDRFIDLRKTGHMPGAPQPFRYFLTAVFMMFGLSSGYCYYEYHRRVEIRRKVDLGITTYEERFKTQGLGV